MKSRIYLDDVRIPLDDTWVIIKNYDEFVNVINTIGIDNISIISLDHDLAYEHYYHDGTFKEKTGYDCAIYLIEYCDKNKLDLPQVYTHSMNPIGSENIIAVINDHYKKTKSDLKCYRVTIKHKIE